MRATLAYFTLFRVALAAPSGSKTAILPQSDRNPEKRASEIAEISAGWIYGPSLTGEAAPFPNGTLGNARSKTDYEEWQVDREKIDELFAEDSKNLQAAIEAVSYLSRRELIGLC